MSEALARISLCVDGPRGPDVEFEVTVPAEWFIDGRRIEVDLPSRLACASCAGGGCDACGRSGAFDVPKADAPLELTLPIADGTPGRLRVRIPGCGAQSGDPEQARGHLILSLRVGEMPSRGVQAMVDQALSSAPVKPRVADPAFALRIVLMVVFVSMLFVFLLWFSGWM